MMIQTGTTFFEMTNLLGSKYQTYTAKPHSTDEQLSTKIAKSIYYVSICKIDRNENKIIIERMNPKRFKKFEDCEKVLQNRRLANIAIFPNKSVHFAVSQAFRNEVPLGNELSVFLRVNNKELLLVKPHALRLLDDKEYLYHLNFFKPFLQMLVDEIKAQNNLKQNPPRNEKKVVKQAPPANQKKSFFQKLGFKKK